MKGTNAKHPAPYSAEVIAALRSTLCIENGHLRLGERLHVHDPFAGEGLRLGALCDEIGVIFTGSEIEPEFILDSRVRAADSTTRASYPRVGRSSRLVICTSPVYPNGMADDHHAKDGSIRRTYRTSLAAIRGADRPLYSNNMARWGYRGTPLWSPARAMYWHLAEQAIEQWADLRPQLVLVNVSDFFAGKEREPVVHTWRRLLIEGGFEIENVVQIGTRRYKNGANRNERPEAEALLIARFAA